MRISDWSSDVCSSDLQADLAGRIGIGDAATDRATVARLDMTDIAQSLDQQRQCLVHQRTMLGRRLAGGAPDHQRIIVFADAAQLDHVVDVDQQRRTRQRSEEHTSELQSLMRISYAVFCLTNK